MREEGMALRGLRAASRMGVHRAARGVGRSGVTDSAGASPHPPAAFPPAFPDGAWPRRGPRKLGLGPASPESDLGAGGAVGGPAQP